MGPIDLTIVATRRPELLARTLASFQENLFSRVPIRRAFLNVDPIWGSAEDGDEVARIAGRYVSDLVVRRPDQASYGTAVKWLWDQPQADWFLHLEDDWLLVQPIDPVRLARLTRDPLLAQINLSHWRWNLRRRVPAGYSVGPTFRQTAIAKKMSALLDPERDPEKQIKVNPALAGYAKGLHYRYYAGFFSPPNIQDLGREWRETRGITKTVVDGTSVWT